MANGDECIHCGLQETPHKRPEYAPDGATPCGNFESPVKHLKNCPVLDCNGDCEETLKEREFQAEAAHNRLRNSWYLSPETGNIVFVDMSD